MIVVVSVQAVPPDNSRTYDLPVREVEVNAETYGEALELAQEHVREGERIIGYRVPGRSIPTGGAFGDEVAGVE